MSNSATAAGPPVGSPDETAAFSSAGETHVLVMALSQRVEALQLQIESQQAQIVALTTLNTPVVAAAPAPPSLDPVCQVNLLAQQGLLLDFTELYTHTGPDNEPVHTCSWTIVVTGEVISASAGTKTQAKKNCALLFLARFAQTD